MSGDHQERDRYELFDRYLRGELAEPEMERLAELLDSDATARQAFYEQAEWDTAMTEALQDNTSAATNRKFIGDKSGSARAVPYPNAVLAIAGVIMLTLATILLFQQPSEQLQIARITGLSGSHAWTGDAGQVVRALSVGMRLSGGTVEGLAPDSWLELEFTDGTSISMSGNSMLTYSDQGQKEIHLREGTMTADVKPQPADRPLLVHTRSAMLEVLGTQFEVEAAIASTMLNVNDGKVRIVRLTDGSTVDVPAKHRVTAAPGFELTPVLVPNSVGNWKSTLHLGPTGTMGNWVPPSQDGKARLAAIPYVATLSRNRALTLYSTGFGVSHGENPPVVLHQDSVLKVRGRLTSNHAMYFGVTLRHLSGEPAGKFQTVKPASEFEVGQSFEAVLTIREFRLVPTLIPLKHQLPADPFGLVVESFWCHTLKHDAGLEITEVELVSPHHAMPE